jgi:hypothetical protein
MEMNLRTTKQNNRPSPSQRQKTDELWQMFAQKLQMQEIPPLEATARARILRKIEEKLARKPHPFLRNWQYGFSFALAAMILIVTLPWLFPSPASNVSPPFRALSSPQEIPVPEAAPSVLIPPNDLAGAAVVGKSLAANTGPMVAMNQFLVEPAVLQNLRWSSQEERWTIYRSPDLIAFAPPAGEVQAAIESIRKQTGAVRELEYVGTLIPTESNISFLTQVAGAENLILVQTEAIPHRITLGFVLAELLQQTIRSLIPWGLVFLLGSLIFLLLFAIRKDPLYRWVFLCCLLLAILLPVLQPTNAMRWFSFQAPLQDGTMGNERDGEWTRTYYASGDIDQVAPGFHLALGGTPDLLAPKNSLDIIPSQTAAGLEIIGNDSINARWLLAGANVLLRGLLYLIPLVLYLWIVLLGKRQTIPVKFPQSLQ